MPNTHPHRQKDMTCNLSRIILTLSELPNAQELISRIVPQIDWAEEAVYQKSWFDRPEECKASTRDSLFMFLPEKTLTQCITPLMFVDKYDREEKIPFHYLAISGRKDFFKAYIDAYFQFSNEDNSERQFSSYSSWGIETFTSNLSSTLSTLIENNFKPHRQVENNITITPSEYVDKVFDGYEYYLDKSLAVAEKNKADKGMDLYFDHTKAHKKLKKITQLYKAATFFALGDHEKTQTVLENKKYTLTDMLNIFEQTADYRGARDSKSAFISATYNNKTVVQIEKFLNFIEGSKIGRPEVLSGFLKETTERLVSTYIYQSRYVFSENQHTSYGTAEYRDETLTENVLDYIEKEKILQCFQNHKLTKDFFQSYLVEKSEDNFAEVLAGYRAQNPRAIMAILSLYEQYGVPFEIEIDKNTRMALNKDEVLSLCHYIDKIAETKSLGNSEKEKNEEFSNPKNIQKELNKEKDKDNQRRNLNSYYQSPHFLVRQAQIEEVLPNILEHRVFKDIYTNFQPEKVERHKIETIIQNQYLSGLVKRGSMTLHPLSPQAQEKLDLEFQIEFKSQQKNKPIFKT